MYPKEVISKNAKWPIGFGYHLCKFVANFEKKSC